MANPSWYFLSSADFCHSYTRPHKSTITSYARRHVRLSWKVLKLLTPPSVWDQWCEDFKPTDFDCAGDVTLQASLERCLFHAYNMTTLPPAEQHREEWQFLIQNSIRRLIYPEECGAHTYGVLTVGLGCSMDDVDNQVYLLHDVRYGGNAFILYTFNEPERSRLALKSLYDAQPDDEFIPTDNVLEHVEVSYVIGPARVYSTFAMGIVGQVHKKEIEAYRTAEKTVQHATEAQIVDADDLYLPQHVLDIEGGMHSSAPEELDAKEDEDESEADGAPIVLLTEAQRRAAAMDNVAGGNGKRVDCYQFDTTPVSEAEEYFSSGDDTLGAGSGMGSSTHSFFSGDTHTTGVADANQEEEAENKYDIDDVDDEDFNIPFDIPAAEEVHEDNDRNENDDADEDNEDNNNEENEIYEGSEFGEDDEEIPEVDEFGVRRGKGARAGYDDYTTIRAHNLFPPETPKALKRSPSKKVLRALRTFLGIKH